MPIWIWIIFAGILVSAWMSVYTARQDRKKEHEWIEQEGQKYIETDEGRAGRQRKRATTRNRTLEKDVPKGLTLAYSYRKFIVLLTL